MQCYHEMCTTKSGTCKKFNAHTRLTEEKNKLKLVDLVFYSESASNYSVPLCCLDFSGLKEVELLLKLYSYHDQYQYCYHSFLPKIISSVDNTLHH